LLSGCATGYGTLAAIGGGMALGSAGAISAAERGETGVGVYVLEGAILGAILGAIGAGVAAKVAKSEVRSELEKERELDEFRAWRRQHPEGTQPRASEPAVAPQSVRSPLYPLPAVQEESVRTVDASMLPNPYPVNQPAR
jgi:hypothetical protein